MNYRVRWLDGSATEDVDYNESMQLIKDRPGEWAGVQPMSYGQDLLSDVDTSLVNGHVKQNRNFER